jgi:hypothetical protein
MGAAICGLELFDRTPFYPYPCPAPSAGSESPSGLTPEA